MVTTGVRIDSGISQAGESVVVKSKKERPWVVNAAIYAGSAALTSIVGYALTHQPVPHDLVDQGYSIMGVAGSVFTGLGGILIPAITSAFALESEVPAKSSVGRRIAYGVGGAFGGAAIGIASGFIR